MTTSTLPAPLQKLLTMDDLRIARLMGLLTEPGPLSDAQIVLAHEFTQVLDQPWQIANFIPSLAVGAVRQVVCEFAVPAQQLGICRGLGLALTTFTDFGNVQWQLLVNGGAVTGFDNIRGQIGSIIFPQPLSVPLFRGSKIQVVATNIGVAPVLFVTARIGGDTFNALTLSGSPTGG
jgi:hypothetical protein